MKTMVSNLKPSEKASFSEGQLNSLAASADAIQLKVGAIYINSIPQIFHGEKTLRGNTSNRVYVFERDESNTFTVMPFTMLNGLFIQTVEDWTKAGKPALEVEERTDTNGKVYHRPICSYHPVTENGNIQFTPNGSDVEAPIFAVRVVSRPACISAQYQTEAQMQKEGRAAREVLLNADKTANLAARNTYFLQKIEGEELEELLKEYPKSSEELKEWFKSCGNEENFSIVEPWLLA